MSDPKDGGPAFPQADYDGMGNLRTKLIGGMSLRDYFAAQALGAAIALSNTGAFGVEAERRGITPPQGVAQMAYAVADAMLAERNKS